MCTHKKDRDAVHSGKLSFFSTDMSNPFCVIWLSFLATYVIVLCISIFIALPIATDAAGTSGKISLLSGDSLTVFVDAFVPTAITMSLGILMQSESFLPEINCTHRAGLLISIIITLVYAIVYVFARSNNYSGLLLGLLWASLFVIFISALSLYLFYAKKKRLKGSPSR